MIRENVQSVPCEGLDSRQKAALSRLSHAMRTERAVFMHVLYRRGPGVDRGRVQIVLCPREVKITTPLILYKFSPNLIAHGFPETTRGHRTIWTGALRGGAAKTARPHLRSVIRRITNGRRAPAGDLPSNLLCRCA
jgi:hypothetical protein